METSATATMPRASQAISFDAIIVAAGKGRRLGGDVPKQYRSLGGLTVLDRTVETFRKCQGLRRLVIVIDPQDRGLYEQSRVGMTRHEPVAGGATRMDSVRAGIAHLAGDPPDIVLIHDAARPFVTVAGIEAVAREAMTSGAATLATKVTDTLRSEDGTYPERDLLWAVQTPQAFRFVLIAQAYEGQATQAATDDTSLVSAIGHPVAFVEGSRNNIKITTQDDWKMAEMLVREAIPRLELRIGNGFDVHAFDAAKPGPVRVCGIDITHPQALEGHSDADIGLHALTDAIFGALGAQDIGHHFPSSDQRWRGAASSLFLARAVSHVAQRGARILNLDLTLICEAPKFGPHRDAMQERVAEICNIGSSRVSIKATTTQTLGFLGRREGIAAQATALLEVPVGEDD